MTDYIDREAALREVCRECNVPDPSEKEVCPYRFTGCREYAALVVVPAADVRPVVRGKWILRPDEVQNPDNVSNGNYEYECSACGHGDLHCPSVAVNYCWFCGADMRDMNTEG